MKPRTAQAHSELTSLVISPNRELAQLFCATLPLTRSFHILAEMKSYPPVQTLDIRLRQLRPDLVFLDLASDLDLAAELIEFIAGIRPTVFVVAFFLKINPEFSLIDALSQMDGAGEPDWSSLVVTSEGIDVLPAPDIPGGGSIDPDRLHDALESVRELYDWIVVDLPSIYEKISLLTMSDCDEAFLVSTSELPSLHQTRKAVAYLGGVGFGMERYRVLVNRLAKQENITSEDMAKLFGAPVHATFPNDYLSIHKGLTVGAPLGAKCPLGKSVDNFAGQIAARALAEKKKTATAQLN